MKGLGIALLCAGAALAAGPEEFSTSGGVVVITPIQHASLMLKAAGKVLYVDPAQGSYEGLPPADYILITDIHGDHMVPSLVARLKKADTVILGPKAVAAQVPGTTVISKWRDAKNGRVPGGGRAHVQSQAGRQRPDLP